SNQVALYIHIRAVSVLYQLSIKVPKAMAIAKTINKTDINRVEKKNFLRSSVIFGRRFDSSVQKYIYNRFLDRKSTRLNSSHVKISYAVFCLKKKKKKNRKI